MLDAWLLLKNELFALTDILLAHHLPIPANILQAPHEKTALTQDGPQQFLIQKAEKDSTALSHTMPEAEEILREQIEKMQFIATLKAYLQAMDIPLLIHTPKHIALLIRTIDTATHLEKCIKFNLE